MLSKDRWYNLSTGDEINLMEGSQVYVVISVNQDDRRDSIAICPKGGKTCRVLVKEERRLITNVNKNNND
jgi:hypothetical protein